MRGIDDRNERKGIEHGYQACKSVLRSGMVASAAAADLVLPPAPRLGARRSRPAAHADRAQGPAAATDSARSYRPRRCTDTYIVAASWGQRLDWFRNIQKQPHVLADVGDRRFEAIAARLPEAKAQKILHNYACQYPSAFRNLVGTMIEWQRIGLDDYQMLAHAIRLIVLRPLHR
jgi:hypothetical protein